MAHMSLGSLWGVAASAVLAAGVSLVTILQVGDGPEFLHQLGTISLLTLLLWISTRTQCSVQCWVSVISSSPGKCQTLTYTQS